MNSQSWQTVVSLGVVALAAAWWSRHFWRAWANPSATTPCGGCSGCPNNAAQTPGSQTPGSPGGGFVPLAALENTAARHAASPVQTEIR